MKEKFKKNKISYNWLRIFYPVGMGEKKERLIPYIINELQNNRKPKINNANYVKDIMHISDCANAIIKTIESSYIGPVNIASGKGISIKSIAEKIIYNLGYGSVIFAKNVIKINDQKLYMVADNDTLRKKIKYNVQYSSNKIIKDYCKEYFEN